jgi:uncharacterized membrane protein
MPSAQRRLAWGLVIAAMLVYAAELGFRALMRYWTFRATAFDLGNMDQVVWNTLHGHFFEFTNRGWDYYGPPTRLAVHVEPILLPISLLYLIHAGPETLLIFQTLALTLGALPVFLLARRWLPRWPLVGVVLVLCYLTSPVLIGENLFDFHAVTLATPLLLAAVLAMDARRYGWFLLTAGLAALCKEDIGITVAILGLFIAFGKAHRTERAGRTAGFPTGRGGGRTAAVPGGRGGVLQWVGCTAAVPGGRGGVFQRALAGIRGHKRRWFGLTVAAVSFAWSLICFFVIIPHYLHSPQVGNNFWQRYAGLGNTPGEALLHLLTQPWLIFTAILTLGKLRYVFNLLMSSGLIGLLAPLALLPALPELGINLLSNKPDQYSGVYHYNAVLLAFLMVAAIQGTATIARRWEQDRDDWATRNRYGRMRLLLRGRALWHWVPLWGWWLTLKLGNAWAGVVRRISPRVGMALVCLVLLTSTGYTLLAAQGPLQEFASPFSVGAREARINRLLAMIPPDASVSASDTLNPHLSEREHLYLFPDLGSGDDLADYIVIDVDFLPYENRATALHTFNTLTASGQYRIIARAGSVYLARLQLPDSDPTG